VCTTKSQAVEQGSTAAAHLSQAYTCIARCRNGVLGGHGGVCARGGGVSAHSMKDGELAPHVQDGAGFPNTKQTCCAA
jgi:hypothetical protein